MLDEQGKKWMRHEKIPISKFALENMQVAIEVGHFLIDESHIERFSLHRENRYIVIYVEKGNAILVEEEYYAIEKRTTIIHRCNQNFSLFLDDCEVYYAVLEGPHIEHFLKEDRFVLDLQFSKKTEIFFHSLFLSLDKYKKVDEYSIGSSVLRYYSDLHSHVSGVKKANEHQDMIDKALDFIEHHYREDLRLSEIAKASGYSEYYFLHCFKTIMDMTPYEYLVRKRLSQVKILLMSTNMTISEIAQECGFKSDISLYKSFKNTYNITTREFKKVHR